jgi:hypothetical protein
LTNLLTALFGKITSSTNLYADIGGRVYLDQAPEGAQFPYVVVSIITGTTDDTFTDKIDDVLIQFSLFSTSKSVTEISTMYTDLRALFDNATMTITSNVFLSCKRQNIVTMVEEITTEEGTETVKHWAVDYNITLKEGA